MALALLGDHLLQVAFVFVYLLIIRANPSGIATAARRVTNSHFVLCCSFIIENNYLVTYHIHIHIHTHRPTHIT